MTLQPITIALPESLYNQIRRRAEKSLWTVEEKLLDGVVSAMPTNEELPESITTALTALELLDEDSLWRAARSHMPTEAVNEIEDLHLKREEQGLNETKKQTLAGLLQQYERTLLVRAQSAAILKQRGHDMSASP